MRFSDKSGKRRTPQVFVVNDPDVRDDAVRAGIMELARMRGFGRISVCARSTACAEIRAKRSVGAADGMISHACAFREQELSDGLRVPRVVWDDGAAEGWSVVAADRLSVCAVDNRSVGRLAFEYFRNRGDFRSFVYVDREAARQRNWWARTRGAAFAACVRQRTHRQVEWISLPDVPSVASLFRLADRLRSLPSPVAVFACGDTVAEAVVSVCEAAGLPMPDRIAVLGVTGIEPIAADVLRKFPSVWIDFVKLGRLALQQMLRMLTTDGPGARRLLIPLEIRDPSATTDGDVRDAYVDRAREFIARYSTGDLDVSKVVEHCGTSRSYLERKFKVVLGRTILEAIHEQLIGRIYAWVTETDKPVREIAEISGFSISGLCALFKREFGVGIRTFRARLRAARRGA